MVSPSPSTALTTLRPDLSEGLVQFDLFMNQEKMIARRVFPVIDCNLQSGTFRKIKRESLLKSVETARASGAPYNFTEMDFTEDSYSTLENGLAMPIDRRNASIYSAYDLDKMAAELVRHTVLMNQEIRVAAKVFDSSTFTPTAVSTEWSTVASATPITDVEAAVQRLMAKGYRPNALIMSEIVFRNLANCDQIIDRINSAGAGSATKPSDITANMLAQCFRLDKIIVGGAMKPTSNEGAATFTMGQVWSNEYCAVTSVADDGASLMTPAVGRTFHWGGDGSSPEGVFETYEDPSIRGDRIRYRLETQEKVLYTDIVELLSNITA